MNKLLILLLILVIIKLVFDKLFNYKEGLCPDKCSNCKYININSIINGEDDCGKDCISCTNIPMSEHLKIFLEKIFGKIKIYTESLNGVSTNIEISDTTTDSTTDTTTDTTTTDSTTTDSTKLDINQLWTDISNGDIHPSIYTCKKDISDNLVPNKNGDVDCILDVNGIWRQYEDISCSENCESIKCIADFGTEIGQLTCCGQNSLLKSTKYVCPSNLPTCNKFKCGSEFGTCSK